MPNRLQQATSPYLLQHADNPVDWYPWGDESLALARQQDKPILLSIGYSACHWCHVMAHESFEDAATAVVMNELFVNIKVDREERPDLDKIYQTAHQLLSQRPGGWPLTVFLTPDDRIPFFAGTYFPSEHRHGLPAFRELLRSVAEFYHTHHAAIVEQNQSLLEGLRSLMPKASDSGRVLGLAPLDVAHRQLGESFDRVHGGFGTPPKFPHPTSLQRLLRHWTLTCHHGKPDEQAATMLQHTLAHMALGGMNDQLAGGFCRYSVDERWEIPHFEKMLYDNGALLSVYTQAWAASGNSLFEATVRGTANWIMTTMQSPDGGYYSSMDADSEGEEGRYYVWSRERVRELLSEEEYRPFATLFGLNDTPNFEGRWHLHATPESLKKAADFEDFAILIASAKSKLLAERVTRVPPGTDDKVLTSWNALAIKGMAMAARLFDEAAWRYSAEKAVVFIRATLWKDGRLLATARNGEAQLNAYLDDYVFLIDALLELLQCRWRAEYYDFAVQLAEVVLDHFDDPSDGGFFFTADDQEALLYRPKPLTDDATPSGNGVAAQVLGRMGHLSGDARYLDAARRTLELAWPEVNAMPYAYCSLLDALEEYLEPPRIIVLRGPRTAINAWRRCVDRHYLPGRICLAIDETATDLPDTLAQPLPANGGVAAYICEGTQCRAPITDQAAFETRLSQP